METLTIVSVVLGALLVGVLIPVLVELRTTLRSVRRLVEETRPVLAQSLAETHAAAVGVVRITSALEPAAPRVADLVDAMGGATAALRRLQTGLGLASAIAPAIMAAVKAFQAISAAKSAGNTPGGADDASDLSATPAPSAVASRGQVPEGRDVTGADQAASPRVSQAVLSQLYMEIEHE